MSIVPDRPADPITPPLSVIAVWPEPHEVGPCWLCGATTDQVALCRHTTFLVWQHACCPEPSPR